MNLSILKSIFASVEQGILFIDDQNRIIYCNPAAEKIRNIKLDQILGQSILECHPQKARPKVLQIISEVRSGKVRGRHLMNIEMVGRKFYDNTYSAVWGPKNK